MLFKKLKAMTAAEKKYLQESINNGTAVVFENITRVGSLLDKISKCDRDARIVFLEGGQWTPKAISEIKEEEEPIIDSPDNKVKKYLKITLVG